MKMRVFERDRTAVNKNHNLAPKPLSHEHHIIYLLCYVTIQGVEPRYTVLQTVA